MTAFEQPPAVPETSSVAPASSVGAPLEQVPLEQAPTEPVHIEPLILKKHPLPLRTFLPIVEKTDDILLWLLLKPALSPRHRLYWSDFALPRSACGQAFPCSCAILPAPEPKSVPDSGSSFPESPPSHPQSLWLWLFLLWKLLCLHPIRHDSLRRISVVPDIPNNYGHRSRREYPSTSYACPRLSPTAFRYSG